MVKKYDNNEATSTVTRELMEEKKMRETAEKEEQRGKRRGEEGKTT